MAISADGRIESSVGFTGPVPSDPPASEPVEDPADVKVQFRSFRLEIHPATTVFGMLLATVVLLSFRL